MRFFMQSSQLITRTDFDDRSHTAHNLQTALSSAQEYIVVYLRKHLLLPLDDLLSVTREFLCPEVSCSGLNRCLRRYGVGNLREMTRSQDNKPKYQRFKDYPIGFVHIDIKYLPQMADESKRRYLFVGIDRATRMVCVQLRESKTAKDAREFLKFVTERFPFEIKKVLADNGKEFTNKVFGNNTLPIKRTSSISSARAWVLSTDLQRSEDLRLMAWSRGSMDVSPIS